MKSVNRFFLFCSGIHDSVLKRTPTDHNKFVGIGATVFFTGVLAILASAYAIYTVFDSLWIALAFGLLWGLVIFNLDRYIVSSMKKRGSGWRDFFTAVPRLILATIIAVVISKPLELKIFEKEINAELVSMEQEVFKMQEDKVKERFNPQIQAYQSEVERLKTEIQNQQNKRDELALIAQQEADGTGGSKQKNLGPIYKAKKADADRAEAELIATLAKNEPLIKEKQEQIRQLEAGTSAGITNLQRSALDGFAARLDALSRLTSRSQAIFVASIFIMMLFIAIETAPIFVKLISSRSPYDLVLHKHEFSFEMNHQEYTTVLGDKTKNRIKYELETDAHRTQAAIKAEKERIDQGGWQMARM